MRAASAIFAVPVSLSSSASIESRSVGSSKFDTGRLISSVPVSLSAVSGDCPPPPG